MELKCPLLSCTCPLRTMIGVVKHILMWHIKAEEDDDQSMIAWAREALKINCSAGPTASILASAGNVALEAHLKDDDGSVVEVKAKQPLFQCGLCPSSFYNRAALRVHMDACHDRQPDMNLHRCRVCGKEFLRQSNLLRHESTVHALPHESNVEIIDYTCFHCNATFNDPESLSNHAKEVHSDAFKCRICEKSYSQKKSLKGHEAKIHKLSSCINPKNSYKCIVCGDCFRVKSEFIDHVSTEHSESFHCKLCNKSYSLKSSLDQHKATAHADIKEEQQQRKQEEVEKEQQETTQAQGEGEDEMLKASNEQFELPQAMDGDEDSEEDGILVINENFINNDEEIQKNPDNEDFSDSETLEEPQDAQDITEGEGIKKKQEDLENQANPEEDVDMSEVHIKQEPHNLPGEHLDQMSLTFQCRVCPKSFTILSNLIRHEGEVHIVAPNQDVLACLHCPKEFSEAEPLVSHVQEEHSMMYECPECGQGFNHSTRLRAHERIKHKIVKMVRKNKAAKLYECGLCEKTFTKMSTLQEHMANHN